MRLPLLCLLLSSAACAYGQYSTNLTLQKNHFLIGEPVLAEVTITNRSGADVILGGVGSRPWLQFQFQDDQGRVLSPVSISSREALTLKPGATTRYTVEIEGASSTNALGTIYATGSIFHPLSGQYYATNRARISVTDAKPIYDEGFGVPQGYPQAGRARRYQALIFREVSSVQFYARLLDERTGDNLSTQLLGPINNSIQPQIQIDPQNRLHLFFLAQPYVFCHTIIKPDGKLSKRDYYRDAAGNRPTLVITKKGGEILGGEYFDPSKPPPSKGSGIRKASDRPKGL
jgi:hypothetical protein